MLVVRSEAGGDSFAAEKGFKDVVADLWCDVEQPYELCWRPLEPC